MATDYGYILSASQAAPILAAFGISPDDDIGYSGMPVNYGGKSYWIAQNETKFPNPTSSSPDGWHIVYAPSQEEIDILKPPAEAFDWDQLITLAMLGIGAYVAVNVLGLFKK